MNWTAVASVFVKEAGIPRALRDPETLRRLAEQLRGSPHESDRLAARSALLRTQAHVRGRQAASSLNIERHLERSMDRMQAAGIEVPQQTIDLGTTVSDRTSQLQGGGERSRAAGRLLQGLVGPSRRTPTRMGATDLSHETPESYLSRYYGRELPPADAAPAAPALAERSGGSAARGSSSSSRGSSSSSGGSGNAGRNAALALAAAALIGGGAYLWKKKRDDAEAERPAEERWSTAER